MASKVTMELGIDHIGILVSSLERSLRSIQPHGWPVGDVEEFPTEGTREVEVGPPGATGRILLMQAIGEGPYRNAMLKRGPGIHHFAIKVPEVTAYLDRVSGSGWYLHPKSLGTYKRHKTVWLSRPGVPILVEVVEETGIHDSDRDIVSFVERIELPLPDDKPLMAESLGVGGSVQVSSRQGTFITIGGNRHTLDEVMDVAG